MLAWTLSDSYYELLHQHIQTEKDKKRKALIGRRALIQACREMLRLKDSMHEDNGTRQAKRNKKFETIKQTNKKTKQEPAANSPVEPFSRISGTAQHSSGGLSP
ncbi:hypothetical protein PoB_002833300 [Plakobranchus ocellatus]|uniref:Uncharacterized protein n=1 Tax=Plakobranchus ocellatus TaxID=259542 RepID=A0AAV4A5B5_9GAST|nr:hypothetical protein PoB_002833300 [Plakobranchus ocellatus]